MRLIFVFFGFFSYIFAQNLDFNSINSNFLQKITSPEGSTLIYRGEFYAKKPHFVLWNYQTPVKKSVYYQNKQVVVIEPELEQVIISNVENMPNLSNILKSAKKISKDTYKAKYQNINYEIKLKNDLPFKISYVDKLENNVSIILTDTNVNIVLDNALFIYKVPKGYDILRQ